MTGSGGLSQAVKPDINTQPGFQSVAQIQAAPQPGAPGSLDDKLQQQGSQVQQQIQNQVNYGNFWTQQAQHVPNFNELTPLNTHLIPPVLAQAFQLPMPDWAAQGYAFGPQLMYGYMPQPQSNPFDVGKQGQDGTAKLPQGSGQSKTSAQQQSQGGACGDQQQQEKAQQQMPRPPFQPTMFPYGNGFQPGAPVGLPAQLGMASPYHMMHGMMGPMPFDGSFQQIPQSFMPGPQFPQQQPLYPAAGYMDYSQQGQRPKRPLPSSFANASGSEQGPDREASTQAVKRQRLVWTKELHERFVRAVNRFGADKAMPKQILQMMNVEGLTRENIASHLQKYRIQLKKQETQGGDTYECATTNDTNGHFDPPDVGEDKTPSLHPGPSDGVDAALQDNASGPNVKGTVTTRDIEAGESHADNNNMEQKTKNVAHGQTVSDRHGSGGAIDPQNNISKSTNDLTHVGDPDSHNGFCIPTKSTGAVIAEGPGTATKVKPVQGGASDGTAIATNDTSGHWSQTKHPSVAHSSKRQVGSASPQTGRTDGGEQDNL